jgi:hypothetical protein
MTTSHPDTAALAAEALGMHERLHDVADEADDEGDMGLADMLHDAANLLKNLAALAQRPESTSERAQGAEPSANADCGALAQQPEATSTGRQEQPPEENLLHPLRNAFEKLMNGRFGGDYCLSSFCQGDGKKFRYLYPTAARAWEIFKAGADAKPAQAISAQGAEVELPEPYFGEPTSLEDTHLGPCFSAAQMLAYGAARAHHAGHVEESMDMALCEIRSVVIRPGQRYTFSRVGDCEKCAEMEREAIEAYGAPPERPAGRHMLVARNHRDGQVEEAVRRDAERYRWLCENSFDREGVTQVALFLKTWEPHSQTGEPTMWSQRIRGPAIDVFIDAARAQLGGKGGES